MTESRSLPCSAPCHQSRGAAERHSLTPLASTSHALLWMTNAPLKPISILLRPGKQTRVDRRVGFDAKALAAPRRCAFTSSGNGATDVHQLVDFDARSADPVDPSLAADTRRRAHRPAKNSSQIFVQLARGGGGGTWSCKVSRSDFAPQITIYMGLTKTRARLRNR